MSKAKRFTDEDKLQLMLQLEQHYTNEELKDFIAKCVVESAMLILAPAVGGMNTERDRMLGIIEELRDKALAILMVRGKQKEGGELEN